MPGMPSVFCPSTHRTLLRSRPGLSKANSRLNAQVAPEDTGSNLPDPEAKFRRYGKFFGGNYWFARDFLDSAPRVRFRKSVDRGVDQLSELAILNERLAGGKSWEIRRKVGILSNRGGFHC